MKKILIIILICSGFFNSYGQTFTARYNSTTGAVPAGGTSPFYDPDPLQQQTVYGGFSCFPLTVKGVGSIGGLKGLSSITIDSILCPNDQALKIVLTSPDGTGVLLARAPVNGGVNFIGTKFSESSTTPVSNDVAPYTGTYQPVNFLGRINNGQNADGDWKLCIFDSTPDVIGVTVLKWSLTFDSTAVVQTIPSCTTNPPAGDSCENAPFICNLNGFCGVTRTPYTPHYWNELRLAFYGCNSTIENNSFIKFIASSTNASFHVWVENPRFNGLGIQMFFFEGTCEGSVVSHGCYNSIPVNDRVPQTITAYNLTVGNTYYLMFDGARGDICDYVIVPLDGVNVLTVSAFPKDPKICKGDSITFNATGGLVQSYTWTTSLNPSGLDTTSGPITVLNTNLITAPLPVVDTVTVRVKSAAGDCKETSSLYLTILPKPVFIDPTPSYQIGPVGFPAIPLTIPPPNTGLYYQWYSNTVSSNIGGVQLVGDTSPTFTPPTQKVGTMYYYCLSGNGSCSKPSAVDTVIVTNQCQTITVQPPTNSIMVCQNIALTQPITIVATNATSYQWYQNTTPSNTGGTLIAGATHSSYYPPTSALGTTYYYCVISGICGQPITSTVSGPITILPTSVYVPAISSPNTQICVGGNAQLSNAVSNGVWASDNTSVASVNPSTGLVTGISPGIANITYAVSGICGIGTSPQFPITVIAPPNPPTIAGAQPVCAGSNTSLLTLNPPATGNIIWQSSTDGINFTTIQGQTGQTYIATNLTISTYYQVVLSNGVCPNVVGNKVLLQVNQHPKAGTISSTPPVCAGKNSSTLTLTGASGSISWYYSTDGVNYLPILSQTNPVYSPINLDTTTYFEAIVSNGAVCNPDTANTTIVVQPKTPVSIALSVDNPSICIGKKVSFTAIPVNQGSSPTYQWQKNGLNVGTNSTTYVDSTLTATDKITCILTSSATCAFPTTDTSTALSVMVYDSTTSITQQIACSNLLPFAWNGNTYNTSGTYKVHLANLNGCDSIATLVLKVANPVTTTINDSICKGSSYLFNGTAYAQSGTYTAKLQAASGCDSTVTLNLTVKPLAVSLSQAKSCSSYLWNGKTYTQSGMYSDTFPKSSVLGCDSIANLSLTINQPTTSTSVVANCNNFLWNGTTYTQSGTYTKVFPAGNANGCDSTATLQLTINHPTFGADTIKACNTYFWNGITYTSSGDYSFLIVGGNSNGCDSTARLHLTIGLPTTSYDTTSACSAYVWNSNTYTQSGDYKYVFPNGNAMGCDSTAMLHLTINNPTSSTQSITTCGYYTWNGTTYTTSGTYSKTYVGGNSKGCDSIANLILTLNSPSTTQFDTSCSAYVWNGETYTKSGAYIKSFPVGNTNGCDSTVVLFLTIHNPTFGFDTLKACNAYIWNGKTYTQSGDYTYLITSGNSVGCDSTAMLHLTIGTSTYSHDTITACSSYFWNGTSYTKSGDFTKLFPNGNSNGCDSTAMLHLVINSPSASTQTATACGSYTWNGFTYNQSGIYKKLFAGGNSKGCDSTATLFLTINQPSDSTIHASICTGSSYIFNGKAYNISGSYTQTLTNSVGCDSLVTLVLTVNSPSISNTTQTICSNTLPYLWNGLSCTGSGSYVIHLTNAKGCDSAATLLLTVNPVSASNSYDTLCSSALPYIWNGNSYTSTGSYLVHLYNYNGCDSTATLFLTVKQSNSSTTTDSICNGASYVFNGIAYTASGTYTSLLTNQIGCDSTAKLVLNVKPKVLPTFAPITFCIGATVPMLPLVSTEGIKGSWSPSIIDSTHSTSYSFTPFSGQCADTTNLQVTVYYKPNVLPIIGSDSVIVVDQTIQLTDSTQGGIWSVNPSDIANIDANGLFKGLSSGIATVTYTLPNLTNPCGDGLADFSITVLAPSVYIPNLFTPNGDGHNDLFYIRGSKFISNAMDLKVYSQWGALLFHSTGQIEDPSFGWDGNYQGKVQPTGVYIYVANLTFKNGQTIKKTGSINLVR